MARKKRAATKELLVLPPANTGARTARNRRRRLKRLEKIRSLTSSLSGMGITAGSQGVGYKPGVRTGGLGTEISEFIHDDLGLASTHDGAIWLGKVLDPCHPEGAVLGVPDAVSCNVVSPQYTTVDTIGFPSGFVAADDWNFIEFLDFSAGKVFRMSYQGPLATTTTLAFSTSTLPGAQEVFSGQGYSASRLTYAGVTYEFSGPTLADQGRQVAIQMTPEWKLVALPSLVAESQVFRWPLAGGPVSAPNAEGVATFLRNLAETDPKSFAGAAKDGAYFPIRNTNPFRFKNHEYADTVASGQPLKILINPFWLAMNGASDLVEVPAQHQTLLALAEPWDMSAAVYWVTGIDPKTTYQRTARYGFEVQIEPESPFRPYAHVSPDYDRQAIEAQTDVGTKLESAYPAEFNGLGKLWKKIKNFVGGIPRTIKKVVKIGKPIYDVVAPVVGLPSLPF